MRKSLYILIILIGFLQIIGYVTNIKTIRDIGVITTASPLPIVFTEVKGVETFASDFYFRWEKDNKSYEKQITPAVYSQLHGPYNRRNIFGAAIAYGPVLPKKIWEPVLKYGLCNHILSDELGLPEDTENFSLFIKTRTKGKNDHWTLKAECK